MEINYANEPVTLLEAAVWAGFWLCAMMVLTAITATEKYGQVNKGDLLVNALLSGALTVACRLLVLALWWPLYN